MTDLNSAGVSYARSLIASGDVDKTASWSFSAEDGNALLGKGDDWTNYGRHHLGIDRGAADKTKARWKYPFAKGGALYRSGLEAIRERAGQQGDTAIFDEAGRLLAEIDAKKGFMGPQFKVAPFEFRFLGDAADGAFEGYGSVFNNEDSYGDVVAPGAFTKTLADYKAKGKMPKMLLNHGGMGGFFSSPAPEDMLPIGKWTGMSEDMHGLQCKGQLINLDTELGKRIHGAMKEGQLDGLSIGYMCKDFTRGTKPTDPARTLKAIDLFEVSPVTFPANEAAMISAVKSARITTIREFEDFLRDAGGFSHAAAKAIAASGFKAHRPEPRDEDGNGELTALLRRAASVLNP